MRNQVVPKLGMLWGCLRPLLKRVTWGQLSWHQSGHPALLRGAHVELEHPLLVQHQLPVALARLQPVALLQPHQGLGAHGPGTGSTHELVTQGPVPRVQHATSVSPHERCGEPVGMHLVVREGRSKGMLSAAIGAHGTNSLSVVAVVLATAAETSSLLTPAPPSIVVVVVAPSASVSVVRKLVQLSLLLCRHLC